jgi:2-methylcitrate dehydratase PrpD
MELTRSVSEFILGLKPDEIPNEVMEKAKLHMLDTIGVILAGSKEPVSKKVVNVVRAIGGTPETHTLGEVISTSTANAAMANGTMAHALEYDDVWYKPIGHPSCTVVPVVLALGEKHNLSGKEALVSYVLGLEIQGRIGCAAFNSSPRFTGWHSVGTLGTLGAMVSAARLLELDVDQMRLAFGISSSMAGGMGNQAGSMTKPLHAGLAARNGIMAGLMAREGMTAHPNIIESPIGFAENFLGRDNYDPDLLGRDMGDPFYLLDDANLSIKRYPTCGGNIPVLDTILTLIREHDLSVDDIESVELVNAMVHGIILDHPGDPPSSLAAKFSWRYNIAVALVNQEVSIDSFDHSALKDPRIIDAMKKVKILTPVDDKKDPSMRVRLKKGDELEENFLFEAPGKEEVIQKYSACAGLVLSNGQVEESTNMILGLENVGSMKDFVGLLTER